VKVRKTVSESLSGTALQNDDELQFTTAANETWIFDAWLIVSTASSIPDMKIAITCPAGATLEWSGVGANNAGTDHGIVTGSGSTDAFVLQGTPFKEAIMLRGIVRTASFGGAVRIQWAQQDFSATQVTVEANSYLQASKF
jgi:hypothetical protein